jgi:hypothetical protein
MATPMRVFVDAEHCGQQLFGLFCSVKKAIAFLKLKKAAIDQSFGKMA